MNEFYGDNINRFWFGLVRNHEDGLHLGRVKVRIAGIHGDDVRDADLPWAQVVLPTTEPGINGLGSPPMLKTGAQVFGVFIDGKDSQLPLVLGSVPRLAQAPEKQLQASGGDATSSSVNLSGTNDVSALAWSKNAPGSANQEKALIYFKDKLNLESHQSAGIVGNLMAESGANMDPWAYNKEGGGYGARGIAQWRGGKPGGRIYALEALAASSGVNSIASPQSGNPNYFPFEFQLAFVVYELSGGSLSNEKNALNKLRTTTNASQAAWSIRKFYERPDSAALGDSKYDAKRAGNAIAVMDKYA
jgi:hypothetical protein